jgi:hypothetical protein
MYIYDATLVQRQQRKNQIKFTFAEQKKWPIMEDTQSVACLG